jgi:hypothetical protein
VKPDCIELSYTTRLLDGPVVDVGEGTAVFVGVGDAADVLVGVGDAPGVLVAVGDVTGVDVGVEGTGVLVGVGLEPGAGVGELFRRDARWFL